MIARRTFLAAVVALATVACSREERCQTCGMKIDPKSAWRAELTNADGKTIAFDTPRCAFQAWRGGKVAATAMRVHEYYDASGPIRNAAELRFVIGGDVVGPMGPDLVPVEPSRVSKFIQDHGADRALALAEVTPEILSSLK